MVKLPISPPFFVVSSLLHSWPFLAILAIVVVCPVCSVLRAPYPRVVHVDLHVRAWGPRVTVIFAVCVVLEESSGVYLPLSPCYRLGYLYLLEQRTLIHPAIGECDQAWASNVKTRSNNGNKT